MVAENLKLIIQAEVGKAVADLNRFKTATHQGTAAVGVMNNKLLGWVKSIGAAYISIAALNKLLRFGFGSAQIAADATQIRRALDSMAASSGTSADEIISNLRRASGRTIAELDLMKSASKAALFDLPVNQLGKLMEIARASATATGESVQFMFDSIVTGIARSSPMILDNLGLTMKIGDATEKYAQSIGKTADELSAEERKMATLNAVLEAGAGIMERVGDAASDFTDAERMQAFQSAVKDLRMEIGESLLPAFREVLTVSTSIIDNIKGPLAGAIANFPQIAMVAFKGAFDILRIFFKPSNLFETVKGLVIAIVKTLEVAWNYLPKIAWDRMKLLIEPMRYIGEAFVKVFDWAWANIKNAGATVLNKLFGTDIPQTAIPRLLEGLDAAYDTFVNRSIEKTKTLAIDVAAALKAELAVLKDLGGALGDTEAGERLKKLLEDITALTIRLEESTGGKPAFGPTDEDVNRIAKNYAIIAQAGGGEFESILPALAEYNVALIEYEENLAKAQKTAEAATSVITSFGDSFATALLAAEDFGDALKIGMRAAIASMIQMLAEYAYVQAGIAWAEVLKGNFTQAPAAVAWTAAGTAATVAASAVKAMAQGGIVTRPTMALVGERGPEAVIPLSKAGGMMPVVNVYVQGSVLEEEGLARRITKVMQGAGRGY